MIVTGTLNFFELVRNFGIISSPAGDAYLSGVVVRRDAQGSALPGALLTADFQPNSGDGKLRAQRILAADLTNTEPELPSAAPWRPAVVIWYDMRASHGSLRVDGIDGDVTLFGSRLRAGGFAAPTRGDALKVQIHHDAKGWLAQHIRQPDDYRPIATITGRTDP